MIRFVQKCKQKKDNNKKVIKYYLLDFVVSFM